MATPAENVVSALMASHGVEAVLAIATVALAAATFALVRATRSLVLMTSDLVKATKAISNAEERSNGARLACDLSRDFDLSPDMRAARSAAARDLQAGKWN